MVVLFRHRVIRARFCSSFTFFLFLDLTILEVFYDGLDPGSWMLLWNLNVWSMTHNIRIMVRGWRSQSFISAMLALWLREVKSSCILVGSSIVGIIIRSIWILISSEILREDPTLASVSIFWVKFVNSVANILSYWRYYANLLHLTT